jgi:predicted Zn-ribbon and HTH transcriptional regulator
MTAEERFMSALHSTEPPLALRSVVRDLSGEGKTKDQIYEILEHVVARLRTAPNHAEDEDTVLDLMDALTGFCHPDAELLPD